MNAVLHQPAKSKQSVKVFSREEMASGSIVFRVKGSVCWYTVCLNSNNTISCMDEHGEDCLGFHFYGTCRHVKEVLKQEKAIADAAQQKIDDAEYAAWKAEMGIVDGPVDRQQFVRMFDIYE